MLICNNLLYQIITIDLTVARLQKQYNVKIVKMPALLYISTNILAGILAGKLMVRIKRP